MFIKIYNALLAAIAELPINVFKKKLFNLLCDLCFYNVKDFLNENKLSLFLHLFCSYFFHNVYFMFYRCYFIGITLFDIDYWQISFYYYGII